MFLNGNKLKYFFNKSVNLEAFTNNLRQCDNKRIGLSFQLFKALLDSVANNKLHLYFTRIICHLVYSV